MYTLFGTSPPPKQHIVNCTTCSEPVAGSSIGAIERIPGGQGLASPCVNAVQLHQYQTALALLNSPISCIMSACQ
jgi:hypothetical protein